MDNQEEVHEVYGAEIPYESDMDSDISITLEAQNSMNQELESVKKKVKEAEEELANLRKRQAEMKKRAQDQDDSAVASKEVDARSIYVGNLDYACSAEEVLEHFLSCGTINRVTILSDMFGHPKGYAYVEFDQVEAVQKALRLNETQLHARKLKVSAKRTNFPGMAQFRGRHPNVYSGGYGKDLGTWSPMRFHPY